MQRVTTSELPQARDQALLAPSRGPASKWILPLSPKSSIYLGIRPVASTGREVRDALLEYDDPQEAAAFVFGASPASSLSQEWRLIVVSPDKDTAHCFAIDAGAVLVPPQRQSWRALVREDLSWRYPRVGYTVYSVEEITRQAIRISWPMKYSLHSENAQKFSHRLFEAIRLPAQPPTMSDVLSGLDKIPEPFRTLGYRCQAVVFTALLSLRKRAQKVVGAPVILLVEYGTRAKDISISCFSLALFVVKMYLQLLIVAFLLACDRDLLKASRELRNMADDVRRFDGYERLEKDIEKDE